MNRKDDKEFLLQYFWPTGKKPQAIRLFILFLVAGIVFLPIVIELVAEDYLRKNGAQEAEIGDVNLNPFTGEFSVHDFFAISAEGNEIASELFKINIQWLPLFKKRIVISEISLNKATIDIRQEENGAFAIGPLKVPAPAQDHPPETSPKKETTLGGGVDSFSLNEVLVRFKSPDLSNNFNFKSVVVKKLFTWEKEEDSDFSLQLQLNQGAISLEGTARPFSEEIQVKTKLKIQNASPGWLLPLLKKPEIKSYDGKIDADTHIVFNLTPEALSLALKGKLSHKDGKLHLLSPALKVKQDNFALNGKLSIRKPLNNDPEIYFQGETHLTGLSTSYKSGNKEVPALDLKELSMEKIEFVNNLAKIDTVAFDLLNLNLIRNKKGEMELLESFSSTETPPKKETKAPSKETPETPSIPNIDIGTLAIRGDSQLSFTDKSVSPQFSQTVKPLNLVVKNITNSPTQSASDLSVDLGLSKYSKLNLKGTISPFAYPMGMDIKGNLKGYSLTPLSGYSLQNIGYQISQGQLGSKIHFKINKGQIDSLVSLQLYKLQLEKVTDDSTGLYSKVLGMPLNSALDLVRDKDDNIILDFPIKGDIEDPKFNLSDVMYQILSKQIKEKAISHFAPIGVELLTGVVLPPGSLFVAGKLVEYVLTMRFDPVYFEPMSFVRTKDSNLYMDKVSTLLKERPKTRVILSPNATHFDLLTLRQTSKIATKKISKEKTDPATAKTEIPPQKEEIATLTKLATQRANSVKDYLVSRGIAADRLLVRIPEIELDKNEKPTVGISI